MLFFIPFNLLLAANALLLLIALLTAAILMRLSVSYARASGDSETQGRQKKIAITLIISLLLISLLAAALNILTNPT